MHSAYMARTNLNKGGMPPRKRARCILINEGVAVSTKKGKKAPLKGEIHAKDRQDPSRNPESTYLATDTVPAPAQTVVPSPSVQGLPPRLLNQLKEEGLKTILEEKGLSTDGVVDKYPIVWDSLRFHRFHIFTRPCCLYIPTWFQEFYSVYSDLVPQGKKKASPFRSVESVMVRGKTVRCSSDDINVVLDRATSFEHDYQSMIKTQTLDDLRGWLAPLISDTTPRWITGRAPIEKKDLNISARY
uniref:Putative plant transposon protein domain-containing protein n=1 Tax=Solanum tuberosum TaxID=4113 RepID=M1DCF9_SOLTU